MQSSSWPQKCCPKTHTYSHCWKHDFLFWILLGEILLKKHSNHERRESFLCDIDRQNYQESFHQIFPHEETMEKLRTKKVGTRNLLPKSSGQMRPLRAWLWFLARNSWARFTVWSWDGHRLLPVVVYIDCILYFNIQFIPYVYMYIYMSISSIVWICIIMHYIILDQLGLYMTPWLYWLYYHIADVYLFLLPVAAAGEDL